MILSSFFHIVDNPSRVFSHFVWVKKLSQKAFEGFNVTL